jgi:hypothetical protein
MIRDKRPGTRDYRDESPGKRDQEWDDKDERQG